MKKVFLGGTINDSHWRDYFIPQLKISYFNPVVDEWNDEAYEKEIYERENCDYCLYVITPRLIGVYSIAEAVDDSNKRPEKTIFCIMVKDGDKEFSEFQIKSLIAVGKMIKRNGARWFASLDEVIDFLNADVEDYEESVADRILKWFK